MSTPNQPSVIYTAVMSESRQILTSLAFLSGFLTVEATAADELLYRWQFDQKHMQANSAVPLVGQIELRGQRSPRFDVLSPNALVFDASVNDREFLAAELKLPQLGLPAAALTAEAWVRVDKVLEWGGLFGAIQDNGDFERGWLLGYRKSRFFFALASEKTRRLTYLNSTQEFEPGHWYHVAGTWDGAEQSLFIDGRLAARSRAQSGKIVYPDSAPFGVGAYWDDTEYHGLTGQIEQVSLWKRALDGEEILRRFELRKSQFPGIEATHPQVTDWPTYRRDNQRTGISVNESLSFPLHDQWTYLARKPPEPAWPPPARQDFWNKKHNLKPRVTFDRALPLIAVDDAVYFASSSEDQVVCLDRLTGARRWRIFAEAPVRLAPTYHDGQILFGSDDGYVYCIRADDGSLIWKHRLVDADRQIAGNGRVMSVWPVRSGVLVADGKAFFCAGLFPQQGVFQAAIDIETGKPVARGAISVSAQGYLERRGSKLFVATGRDPAGSFVSQLGRRGKAIGKEVQSIPRRYPYAFIGDSKSRFAGGDGEVAAFDVRTGKQLWHAEVDGRAYSMAICRSCLLVSTDQGAIYCFGSESQNPTETVPDPIRSFPWASADQKRKTEQLVHHALKATDSRRGWALVLNSGDGAAAYELAGNSEFNIVSVEKDAARLLLARERLDAAGMSGRVSFHQARSDRPLPYTDYLFNIVIDVAAWRDEVGSFAADEIQRVTRPDGGVAIIGPESDDVFKRPRLPGIGEWTHQYADAGNTVCSSDERVQGKLRLQWFGAPGPRFMMDRHHRTAAPLWAAGRLFIPGDNRVVAADAYNGTRLWQVDVPNSRRAGVYRDCSYLAAEDGSLYVAAASHCLRLDAETGATTHTYSLPESERQLGTEWGYVATVDGLLFGSRQHAGASRRDHGLAQINEGTYFDGRPLICSNSVFAVNPDSGKQLWHYSPEECEIVNSTIAISDGRMCFIEGTVTAEKRRSGRHRAADLFRNAAWLTALNMRTGEVQWRKLIDFSHIEHTIYLCATQNRLVVSGSHNLTVAEQRLVHFDVTVFDAGSGARLWNRSQNQQARSGGSHGEQDLHPVIVGDRLYCEPFAYNLNTGLPLKDWKWNAGKRRGCGTISASASTFFFRHSHPAMFNLNDNTSSKVTTSTRPGCWINMIPAGGLLLVPEGSSGCTCNYAVQTSMAFLPSSE